MENIIEILKKWNPWEKDIDIGIKRKSYLKKIYPYLSRKEVIVLKGIRRCGKSTIVKQLIYELIRKGVDKKQIIYLNLEEYGFADNLKISLFDEVLNVYRKYSRNRKKIYLFIDEIQKIPSWEKWIRTEYDLNENIKFVITGSSASLLSKELSTLLTGRNVSFTIMPLSFNEYIEFGKKEKKKEKLEEYMKFGGFPEIVLEKSEEKKKVLLQQYFEDIIYKDIVERHNIRNAKQLVEIARYLISSSGSKVSLNKLSHVFGISKDTISLYIGYMIDAYLLFEVSYFSYSAKIRHDVSKLPKIYALDNGLINIATVKYSENRGQMYENTVLIKLLEDYNEVSYWSELASEVDFIVEGKSINVTSTDKTPKREIKGLEDFRKKHKHFLPLLITPSTKKEDTIPLYNFLHDD